MRGTGRISDVDCPILRLQLSHSSFEFDITWALVMTGQRTCESRDVGSSNTGGSFF